MRGSLCPGCSKASLTRMLCPLLVCMCATFRQSGHRRFSRVTKRLQSPTTRLAPSRQLLRLVPAFFCGTASSRPLIGVSHRALAGRKPFFVHSSLPQRSRLMAAFTTSASGLYEHNSADFAQMREEFEASENRISELNPYLRALRSLTNQTFHELMDGSPAVVDSLFTEIFGRVDKVLAIVGNDVNLREGWMSDVLDQVVRTRAFHYFLLTGKLISAQDETLVNRIRDEEYLGGVMGLSNELARYAVKRASQLDVAGVVRCRDLLEQFNGKLLEFEFRNGNLRRKYDGVKWGVKRMEDLLYELSLVGAVAPEGDTSGGVLFDPTELEGIRQRMVQYDEKRENLIKVCRDVQKSSKNAIYSVHRGDLDKAKKLLEAARAGFATLSADLAQHPNLRFGSAEAAIEEYAEAEMFLLWRLNGRLPTKAELGVAVTSTEYFGGLIDFTGEMGRFAVARATARDEVAVRTCLETDVYISGELVRTSVPGKIAKKMDGFRTNHRKLEMMVYEMALIKAGKGRVSETATGTEPEPEAGGKEKD